MANGFFDLFTSQSSESDDPRVPNSRFSELGAALDSGNIEAIRRLNTPELRSHMTDVTIKDVDSRAATAFKEHRAEQRKIAAEKRAQGRLGSQTTKEKQLGIDFLTSKPFPREEEALQSLPGLEERGTLEAGLRALPAKGVAERVGREVLPKPPKKIKQTVAERQETRLLRDLEKLRKDKERVKTTAAEKRIDRQIGRIEDKLKGLTPAKRLDEGQLRKRLSGISLKLEALNRGEVKSLGDPVLDAFAAGLAGGAKNPAFVEFVTTRLKQEEKFLLDQLGESPSPPIQDRAGTLKSILFK